MPITVGSPLCLYGVFVNLRNNFGKVRTIPTFGWFLPRLTGHPAMALELERQLEWHMSLGVDEIPPYRLMSESLRRVPCSSGREDRCPSSQVCEAPVLYWVTGDTYLIQLATGLRTASDRSNLCFPWTVVFGYPSQP
jgi:hypothetical protein